MAQLDRKPRLKLPVAKKPVWAQIARGLSLGYRRNIGAGTWVVRVSDGKGSHWSKAFATADDVEKANGETVLDYEGACNKARELRGGPSTSSDKPITVEQALDAYQADLAARGQDKANVRAVRFHVKGTAIYSKSVGDLKQQEVTDIRNGIVAGGCKPATADRVGKAFKAAMNLAASHDERITNTKAWSKGWALLPNSSVARNVILADNVVAAIVRTAYAMEHRLGVYLDVLAQTGTRESQMLRMVVADLQDDRPDPRLMMPSSLKGRNRIISYKPVPISPRLAGLLRSATVGRSANAPMLDEITEIQAKFKVVAKRAGADLDATPYALRHSSIVRMLIANIPIRIVASLHDTSVEEIESNYSAFITSVTDAMTRATLPDFGEITTSSNVVNLR